MVAIELPEVWKLQGALLFQGLLGQISKKTATTTAYLSPSRLPWFV